MKAKDIRRNGYNQYSPPTFYDREPLEFFISKKEISRVIVEDEAHIDFDPNKKYFISLGLNCGYYPGDSSPEAYLVEYEEIQKPNKNYAKELKIYTEKRERYEEDLKNWDAWKKLFDAEEEIKKEQAERKQYLQLKKKYEQP